MLTKERFQEMLEFEKFLMEWEHAVPPELETADIAAGEPPTTVTFYDLCKKVNVTTQEDEERWRKACEVDKDEAYCLEPAPPKCEYTPRPLDFIYERKGDKFDLERYETDADLVARI